MPDDEVMALHLNSLRAAKMAEGTIKKRRNALRSVIRHIGPTPLLAATYGQLLGWQGMLSGFSAGHIANTVCHVRTFYSWTVKPMRLLTASPADDLVLPRVPRGKPRPVPEADYVRARIAAADLGAYHPIPMWLDLGRWAGARCIEIANLGREDVNPEDPPRLRLVGKGGKTRIVFVARELVTELAPWTLRSGRLFVKANGRPYSAHEVSNMGNEFLHSLGLPYTMHQLRHSYGTRSLEQIGDIRVVQQLMGHESPSTTQLYTEPNQPKAVELAAIQDTQMRALRKRKR